MAITIQNTVLDPGGDPIVGIPVKIELLTDTTAPGASGYINASEASVSWQASTTTDANGAWSQVVPAGNDDIVPAGSVYRVTEIVDRAQVTTHLVDVPTAAGTYWVGSYLATAPDGSASTLHAIGSHSDVDLSAQADGYVMVYVAASGKWEAQDSAGGAPHGITTHTDVDTSGATSDQVLTYDGASWVAQDAPSASGSDGSDHTVASHPDAASYATDLELTAAITAHNADPTSVHGIEDTAALATQSDIDTHNADATGVHGIADTSALVTTSDAATTSAQGIVELATTAEVDTGTDTDRAVTPAALAGSALQSTADGAQAAAEATAAAALSAHEADTTAVHGIADTSALLDSGDVGVTVQGYDAALDAVSGTNTGDEVAATDSVAGVVELATQAEVNAETDTTRVVTPATLGGWTGGGGGGGGATNLTLGTHTSTTLVVESDTGTDVTLPAATGSLAGLMSAAEQAKLAAISGTNSGDEVAATTSTAGVIEIATEAEVETGTDTSRAVTPELLRTRSVGFELTNTTGQYPPEFPTAEAAVVFTAEVVDEESFYTSGTSTSEITIPKDGWYHLQLDYEYTGTLPENVEDLLLNLQVDTGSGFADVRRYRNWGGLSNDWALIGQFVSLIKLDDGDVVRWTCQQADTPGAARYEWIATGVLLG